jgi:hypothetical protein
LTTYLAGRLVQQRGADPAEIPTIVAALQRAAQTAGLAGEEASGRS